ncbi:TetR/AcrR family transcriptional regulator [Zeaxanthinibacter enoshimensis]|uniref:Regulatory TetR family protein n=1 Tax=Zeaxanthinibacter enoshimensis TaxID=392009 RepID=A0A4R6TIU0_9FLAO|nr:TetR/AcrR family transcriptional regulator [Zeaxanthinibacter enoshimensis]TDQ29146.1 regulatory TetR family protein [Zeaxanthinibacter enoshimensis]
MKSLPLHIEIDPAFYCKNPDSTELGRKIITYSIDMIDKLGFEAFTFRKLAKSIGSTESSIYRYFENKHALLAYLFCWYWSWKEYQLVFATNNLEDPGTKLKEAIRILTEEVTEDSSVSYINEVTLHRIIIAESAKVYLTKAVDTENEKGYFRVYKRVVSRVGSFALELNPDYEFPHMLVSTIIEGSHAQRFFSDHLPSLTDTETGKQNIVRFYTEMTFKTIAR